MDGSRKWGGASRGINNGAEEGGVFSSLEPVLPVSVTSLA